MICRKTEGRPYQVPDPPPLVKCRVQETHPFEVTGVDFTGTLYVRDSGKESKVYVCLFTCTVTRAVYLEVVTDLSTEKFLQAFRRFNSRKSLPVIMISDNTSTYLAAADKLKELFSSKSLLDNLSRKEVTWRFIPKRVLWYGGFWECLIGLTKASIKKVLGRSYIGLLDLQTIVVEVEAILNDQPLTYASPDPCNPEPLIPAHLLYGRKIVSLPYRLVDEDSIHDSDYEFDCEVKKRARIRSFLLNRFWKRWKTENLTSLRESHKSTRNNKQVIKKGEVVLVHDNGPRANWRLAVIEDVVTGNDGLIRSVKIRTSTGRTNRLISRLYPFEVSCEEDLKQTSQHSTDDQTTGDSVRSKCVYSQDVRPTRAAALKALAK